MARTSGTQNVKSGGSQTILASDEIKITSQNNNIILSATPTGQVIIKQNGAGLDATTPGFLIAGDDNVASFDTFNGPGVTPDDPVTIDQTQFSTTVQRQQGSAYFAGGVGIEKDLAVGGFIYGRIAAANTATTSTNILIEDKNDSLGYRLVFTTPTGEGGNYRLFKDTNDEATQSGGLPSYAGGEKDYSEQGLVYYPNISSDGGGVLSTDNISVGKDINIGGTVYPINENITGAVLEGLYNKFLDTPAVRNNTLPIGAGMTDMFGELRVRGSNPIGTAPVVTNVLYVTMDGNDTNDGRAQDASRACRTIGGALNSPYYQPGTQIQVSAGHYLEDNPLQLKPYTSIMGSDLRTCSIEPINKTQDLFHMNSGCYLAFMQFLNGRSGLLEGAYAPGFNRGAYATAFPPLPEGERIDLFHSPYIQNCTNLSGPWLKDGTMFTPGQTVQIPTAIGIGTWTAGATEITVNVSTGTIVQGMSINAGQQNPGFFNARTLMLANKPFLQEQVVSHVDATFNSGSFVYDSAKCERDVGLIVDSIAIDMLQDSTSESTFAGIQYWAQDATPTEITGEVTTTTQAIGFAGQEAAAIALSVGNATLETRVNTLFSTVTNIITNGFDNAVISNWIYDNPNGLASTDTTVVAVFDALVAAKDTIASDTIDWIAANHPGFVYNTSTCYRDVGYMIDSVAFDLLHGGFKQSIKSGVYYFGYTDVTTIPGEIPQTTAAYGFIKSIVSKIVKGVELDSYQTGGSPVLQVTNLPPASEAETDTLEQGLDIITSIIRNGPAGVTRIPINLITNETTRVANAYALLMANREFIQAETIAYIDQAFNSFTYSREKCYRDVGILVENMAYDAAFGGNEKSVESGLAYYNGVVSVIAGQEIQTTAAIDYLRDLTLQVITNTTCTNVYASTATQVINWVLTDGDIASNSIKNCYGIVTDIINNGPSAAPDVYKTSNVDAAFVSAEILMQANRTFIQENVINYVNNRLVSEGKAPLSFNRVKCKRDVGLIVDSVALDMLYPTSGNSQSTFAGLQYYTQNEYTGDINNEIRQTIGAIEYLKDLSIKVIQNVTPADDLVDRYSTSTTTTQVVNLEAATDNEVDILTTNFDIIIDILNGDIRGWSDRIISNGTISPLRGIQNAAALLSANKAYMAEEVTAYIDATYPGWNYGALGLTLGRAKCQRDVGYMVDSVLFDLLHGGNRQSVQSGLSYYGFENTRTIRETEKTATIASFNLISTIAEKIIQNDDYEDSLQNRVAQVKLSNTATLVEHALLANAINTVTSIINAGTGAIPSWGLTPISTATNVSTTSSYAFDLLIANKEFIKAEVIAYLDKDSTFTYDQDLCYRDTGLIVDAVSQDILLGGNYKSIEAGLAYWNQGYSYVATQVSTTTAAINYAKDIALQIIANNPVTPQTGTVSTQIINPFFQYGGDYMPQEAVARNFNIITDIIERGPTSAPPRYMGGGLFALTGINGADVKLSPTVSSVTTSTTTVGAYVIGLSEPTVGFGSNATLYFGDVSVFPKQNFEVEALSLELTGSTSTWNQRKVDPIGGMGGSLVDGAVISAISPIQSFVYDAYTQLTQGGIGVHITNNGYAQLVSVFTIFGSKAVLVENGGIASITNSNSNFGDLCLVAKGYGTRAFSGTVFNPVFRAYPFSPVGVPGSQELDQYYPNGFWPNRGTVEVFVPDVVDRPHIAQVMEVEPPDGHLNEQGFPGFLNSQPSTGTLTTSSIVLTNIDTTDVAIGNTVYIRDQFGREYDDNGAWYAATGTVVTDLNFNAITLNQALTSGGGDSTNPNYFTLYFCGNSYYTVLSSTVAESPYLPDSNILEVNTNPQYQGPTINQVAAHAASLEFLNGLVVNVIENTVISPTYSTATTQTILPLVNGGEDADSFINQRFDIITSILTATNITVAKSIVPPGAIKKTGTIVPGAGSAVTLIKANLDFLADEVSGFVVTEQPAVFSGLTPEQEAYIISKCKRDTKVILQRIIYDLETGGTYNSVMTGLSYWSRPGTHHVVELGEAATRTDLFPDGATVNFYQRSYISASGYLFEYVGAGTNYGSLPQRGIADPVQSKETVQLNSGKVFFTSTDQNGDFRIGRGLVISQATGVLSGRTFTQSLFANMTPFILAIES